MNYPLAALMVCFVIIGFLTAALLSARRQFQVARSRAVQAERSRSAMEKEVLRTAGVLDDLTQTMRHSRGGIGRRIMECREMARAIHAQSTELFDHDVRLIRGLACMDEFLVALHQGYQGAVKGDAEQMRIASTISPLIYIEMHRDSGIQAPKHLLGTN